MLLEHKRKTETQEDLVKEKQIKCVAQQWQGELCDPETALEVLELLVRENIKARSYPSAGTFHLPRDGIRLQNASFQVLMWQRETAIVILRRKKLRTQS